MASLLTEWQEKDFNALIQGKQSALVKFGAPWCHTCKVTEPMVAEVSLDYPQIPCVKIDVSKNPGLASRMGVMSLPNILIIDNGKVVNQIIGSTTKKAIEDKLKNIAKK